MNLNQDIRYSKGTPNNSNGLYDFIKPTRNIKGSGAPAADLGENEWMYLDEVSGIEYLKQNGIWNPFADLGSFAQVIIPDPLQVTELDVDLIKGRTSDDVLVNVGSGDMNVLGTGLNGIKLSTGGAPNITLQSNGFGSFGSGTRAYGVISDNFAGKEINIDPDLMKIHNTGLAGDMEIENTGGAMNVSGQSVALKGATVDILNSAGSKFADFDDSIDSRLNIRQSPGGAVGLILRGGDGSVISTSANPMKFSHEITNQSINISTKGLGNTDVINGTGICRISPHIRTLEFLGSAGDANIRNVNNNFDLLLTTAGTGAVKIANHGLNMNSLPITSVDDINGGTGLGRYGTLGVEGGNLSYGLSNMAQTFSWVNVGGAEVDEFGSLGFAVNPADVGVMNIGPLSRKINMVSCALMHSAAWSWGGAAVASIEIGMIRELNPCVNANFELLATLNMPLVGDFYTAELPANTNITVLAKAKLCVRLQVTTPAATSTNAELSCTINMN